MGIRTTVSGPPKSQFDVFRIASQQRIEGAASRAVHREGRRAVSDIRTAMQSARLGRLGKAIDSTSDLDKGRVHRRGRSSFSVSSAVHLRTRSERTIGAIESYTAGAEISPRRGRWLWFATDEIPKLTGSGKRKFRLTPELYRKNGLEAKIGPLVFVRSVNGSPLLVVKNATVNQGGKPRSAKSRLKKGGLPKGQRAKDFIVAFVGIPRTARAARIDVPAMMESARQRLPETFNQEMRKG
ncbi:hypothetical protein [Parasphingorhabdus sp.]|uniref:hypothetical protein n=1 Tax=Parasphingorhabdus sp. TaxID=2709688 RepID=UPI003A8F945C